ncbi:hypothetical protein LTR70_003404 [Exophiala xenobiotica]|uniref:Nephrocystin 3-like N-terminal domain-containing protein n=1 Tax=Lithohypha guttulata TaxID=1690604 RepID=A0ABR0KGS1_9EURO|nr:hypothetical protein LTR24_002951 [Lithohypha guttulata]KAK5323542.1 hypothetical protein LTR70_003404 [Exophiala xenobiotica]
MGERPAKRVRLEETEAEVSLLPRSGHNFGSITINTPAPVQLGDRYGSSKQGSPPSGIDDVTDKYDVLLKSLLFDRIDARERNVRKALSRTCDWLFRHSEFLEWRTAQDVSLHNGFLWIKGKPGCGKSTIMKTALEWTRKENRKQHTEQVVVHYFFNARAPSSLEKSSLGLYRSLTYQLLCACPFMRPLFSTKFALKEPGELDDAWTKEELQDFLGDVVTSTEPSGLCIFIDALDEGEHEDDVRQMISFLVDLSERALEPESLCKLRICLSSRHYPQISINKELSLVVEEQPAHGRDIETHIRQKLIGSDGEDKIELRNEIRHKSASIFLWVVLVVDMLNKIRDDGGSLKDTRARLDTIPGDLNKLFKEILAKNIHGVEASVALFQWVLFSIRALEAEELYLAIEYSRSPADATWSPSHKIDAPSTGCLARYILNCSRGLVELTSTQPPVVQFIHETVREFLINENGLASLLPALSANLWGISHEVLKIGCLRYISASEVPKDLERYFTEGHKDNSSYMCLKNNLRKLMPFIDYAASYVYSHAEHAQRHGLSQEPFLRSKTDADGRWRDLDRLWWNVLERFKARKYAGNVTILYFVGEQGYLSLLSTLLKVPNSVNVQCGRYGTALQAACVAGNEQIALSLIANGANVNAGGGEYKHALLAAVLNKKFPLVPVLRKCGAKLDPNLLQRALFTAIARGSPEGVALLLELGANIDVTNDQGKTVLYLAARTDRESVVDLLLQRGANVSAQGGYYGNALQAASASGCEKVVQMLLDSGANGNAQGGIYGNALQAASANGRKKVVQMLLDAGANGNAQGGYYGNALQAASYRGHKNVVQILLDRGAIATERDSV